MGMVYLIFFIVDNVNIMLYNIFINFCLVMSDLLN